MINPNNNDTTISLIVNHASASINAWFALFVISTLIIILLIFNHFIIECRRKRQYKITKSLFSNIKKNDKYHFPSTPLNQYLSFYNDKKPNRPEINSDVESNSILISNSRMKTIDL